VYFLPPTHECTCYSLSYRFVWLEKLRLKPKQLIFETYVLKTNTTNRCCFDRREQLWAAGRRLSVMASSTLVVCGTTSGLTTADSLQVPVNRRHSWCLIKSNLVVGMDDRRPTVSSASLSRLGKTRRHFMPRLTCNRLFCRAATTIDLAVSWQLTRRSLMLGWQPVGALCRSTHE